MSRCGAAGGCVGRSCTTSAKESERPASCVSFASIIRRLRSLLSWRRRPSSEHLALGRQGERAAARYLRRHRYRILVRNYRCIAGEIDLIASQAATIVFVEVKTRQPDEGQSDRLPVGFEQRGRITR